MAEYIEREAASRVLCDACGNAACPKGLIPRCSYYEKMQSIPAADVRPVVRGEWSVLCEYVSISENRRRKTNVKTWMCSNCFVSNGRRKTNFCPNCGADMRET